MNTIKSRITSFMVVILMAASLSACGTKDDSPTAEPLDNSIVAAAEAMTDTLEADTGTALSSAAADRLVGEVAKLEKLLVDKGYTLTNKVADCSGSPEDRVICASDQLAALEKAFSAVINGMDSLQQQYDAVLAELNQLRIHAGNSGSTSVAAGSGSSTTSSGGYATGSAWQCVMEGKPGVKWDADRQDHYVIYNGKPYYGLVGTRYTWTKCTSANASLLKCTPGQVVIMNVNTTCSECHEMGEYAHAKCEAPPPGSGNGNGSGTGSGNGNNGQANARADAEARARAEVDVDVKVDVRVQVQATLVAIGVQVTPIPPTNGGCICTMIWDPVCVILPDGRTIQFSNGCMARCAGYQIFTTCYQPVATATVVNDPLCAMFPGHPNCQKTATPGASPTATRALATATLAPGPATPVPTLPVATPTDCGAELIRTTPFDLVQNMDWGDPHNWTIIQFWNGRDTDTTVQAVIAPGYNLDVEADRLVGTAWIVAGTREQVICRARQMADEHGGIKLLVWVGPDPVPSGFEKPSDKLGYKMSTWQYGAGGVVETPGASWATEQLGLGRDAVCNNGDGITYIQFWDGKDADTVYHVILEKGACVRPPKDVQGSVWHVSGGVRAAVLARLNQMSDEAQDRDNPDSLHRWFIGCGESPSGWNTPSSDWVVVRSASC